MSNMMDMKRAHAAKSSFCAESPSAFHRQQFCKYLSFSFPAALVHIVYSSPSLPLALVRHRGVALPSGSSSVASRPNRRKVSLFGAHGLSRSNTIRLTQELEAQVGQLGGGHGGHGARSGRQIWTRSRWERSR